MDIDWCLTCNKRTDDSSPYCSHECEERPANTSSRRSAFRVVSSGDDNEVPYIPRFTGNDSAGIQAWAADVPRGAPADFSVSLASSLAPIDHPDIEDVSGHGGTSFEHSSLFSAPQDSNSLAPIYPLAIGDTSGRHSLNPFEQSVHMFEQAHDINITGGQFYSATGGMSINTSQDASTHVTYVSQHHLVSNHIVLPRSSDEGLNCQTRRSDNFSCAATSCVDEDGTTREVGMKRECADEDIQCSYLGNQPDTPTSSDFLSEQEDPEQATQLLLPIQVSASIPASSSFKGTLSDFHTDQLIFDTLSRYPPPPAGNFRSFRRILSALLFSFTPLSLPVFAALLGMDNAEHVKQILLPASPFILISGLGKDKAQLDEQGLVRFADASTRDFFLDPTRSQGYYVDGLRAHKVLLDACTRVMASEERKVKGVGWRSAFEYACRHWDGHRHAAGPNTMRSGNTRAKL